MQLKCTKCGTTFHENNADHGSEAVNTDPWAVEHFLVCPECGCAELDEVETEDE